MTRSKYSIEPVDPALYWHEQFLHALAGLSWAVGKLGEEAGYAAIVHERLTHPTITFAPPALTFPGRQS